MTKSPTWDFDLAIQFSKAYETDVLTEIGNPTPLIPIPTQQPYHKPRSLGDFTSIFNAFDSPLFCSEKIESVEATTSLPSSYSSSFEPAEDFDDFVASKSKGVRWHDEVEVESLHTEETTSRSNGEVGRRLHYAHTELEKAVGTGLEQGKLPSSIKYSSPRKASRSSDTFDGSDREKIVIGSKLHMTALQQRTRLIQRLRKRFPDPDSTFVTNPASAALGINGVVDPNGIHVFVDFSNIHIGFQNRMRAARGLHEKAYILHPPFSYHGLSLVLERGRPVARRILVGSHYPRAGHRKESVDFNEAESCGYEINILTRVEKQVPIVPVPRKRNGTGNGYATGTSGDESGMEHTKPIKTEQAVDEILQMKFLESLLDTVEPTTIVLASGDAAEAEYSGGFLKNVERALLRNWKVEVVAWNHGLSREYRNREFVRRWGGNFKIIELDDFAEELLAVYIR